MVKIFNKVLILVFLFVPAFAFAATDAESVLLVVIRLLNMIVPIAITLALLFFIWGLAVFIKDSGNEEKRTEGKHKMFWGVIALFVIVSVWGLVWFIGVTFGIRPGGPGFRLDLPYDRESNRSVYPDGRNVEFNLNP